MTRRPNRVFLLAVLATSLQMLFNLSVSASDLYFIDAHSQVDHNVEDLELIIERMNKADVYRTILAARSGRTPKEVAGFAEKYPVRIIPAVRTKSGAYIRNRPGYYKKIDQQLDSGKFSAMAEILLYHAQKGNKAPEVVVYPNDERVQYALEAAIGRSWPFVIHIEFASLVGSRNGRFMSAMEKLLISHRKHPFVLNHMGQLEPAEVRRLIEKHNNIFFLTAHTSPVIIRRSSQPWVNMFDNEKLTPKWKALAIARPDRLVFALDNVWETHWTRYYMGQIDYWRKAISDLPTKVGHALAHGNAERLWKLIPRPSK